MKRNKILSLALTMIICVMLCGVMCGCANKCAVDGCDNEVSYTNAEELGEYQPIGYLTYCMDHTCHYITHECEEPTNGSSSYCKNHKCLYCDDERIEGKDVCDMHSNCYYYKCEKEPTRGLIWCKEHTCIEEGCVNSIGTGNNEGSKYCSTHGCYTAGCTNKAIKEGHYTYCTKHGCQLCGDKKYENYSYCYEHLDSDTKSKNAQQKADEAAKNASPKLGMTKDQIRKGTWGEPNRINIDEYSWGTLEQWVYEDKGYIYFEDGYVTSISYR